MSHYKDMRQKSSHSGPLRPTSVGVVWRGYCKSCEFACKVIRKRNTLSNVPTHYLGLYVQGYHNHTEDIHDGFSAPVRRENFMQSEDVATKSRLKNDISELTSAKPLTYGDDMGICTQGNYGHHDLIQGHTPTSIIQYGNIASDNTAMTLSSGHSSQIDSYKCNHKPASVKATTVNHNDVLLDRNQKLYDFMHRRQNEFIGGEDDKVTQRFNDFENGLRMIREVSHSVNVSHHMLRDRLYFYN